MKNEIEKIKCPYCGNEKDLYRGDLIDTDLDEDYFRADYDIICPRCKKVFYYTKVFHLERAYNNI